MSDAVIEAGTRRVLLVGDTTLDPLGRFLERNQEMPRLKTTAAPYGQIYQILLDPKNPVWSAVPTFLSCGPRRS